MPPVRLPSDAELAREALAAPLLARAVTLARWAEKGVPVGAGGELLADDLASAAAALGFAPDDEGTGLASDAWNFAVDSGLVHVTESDDDAGDDDEHDDEAGVGPADDTPVGTATAGEELERLTAGDPSDVLDIWTDGVEAVLGDAATPTFEELLGGLPGLGDALTADGEIDPEAIDLDALDWDPDEEADFLDSALASLYLFAVTDEAGQGVSLVPLPMVAAASVLPDDVEELSESDLDELSAAVLKLDDRFTTLAGTGLLDYRPVDESVLAEAGDVTDVSGAADDAEDPDDDDMTRYGLARLTPLGLYGVRRRMLDAGVDAPAFGELADADAAALLAALPYRPEAMAREEAELWLDGRDPLPAARQLLEAARGDDPAAPGRRLGCQLVLSLLGDPAEPAVRDVLDDQQLGGLARVWLAERGAADVPQPDEDMVFWLTIDTLAAQLAAFGDEEEAVELRELVSGLAGQHSDFFERAWRTEHPATADVLEAVGRLHPDRQLAKQARKAAFRSRSREQ
ncbi:hypothetical protein [Streptomyces avicenniae]|uniref:hypothetical protein n=1 Tax=Streptomyces avicenniae TaxID=500153 RepID=UPI00069BA822|nr:hypothetical protein [Streptomyces avicenniae]